MTSVLLVDWLGRGGIAQCTDAWGRVAVSEGHQVTVVTRRHRELAERWPDAATPPAARSALWTHARLVRLAVDLVHQRQPDTVVLGNYLLPAMELSVVRAARRVGARCVVVVHDHRAHQVGESVRAGLGAMLGRADLVVTHSRFVAEHIQPVAGRTPVVCWPLPFHDLLLQDHPAMASPWSRRPQTLSGPIRWPSLAGAPVPWGGSNPAPGSRPPVLMAAHFGVLRRRYKGTGTVVALASAGVPGWRFAFLGAGAPQLSGPNVYCDDRFLPGPELVAAVGASAATLLPYHMATQSGAVVLAQALGSVVVASAVGGIPEQLDGGRSGVLLPAGAGPEAWRQALSDLADDGRRRAVAAYARQAVADRHRRFTDQVRGLLSTGSEPTGSESTGSESTGSESTGSESTGSERTGPAKTPVAEAVRAAIARQP